MPAPRHGPRRIVSLVPSHTESLHALGLAQRVVGRTRFCIHPKPWVDTVPVVGGTKDATAERILALDPDLVVADKDENPKALVDELGAAGVEVVWSDIEDPLQAAAFLERLGERCGVVDAARAWAQRIRGELARGARDGAPGPTPPAPPAGAPSQAWSAPAAEGPGGAGQDHGKGDPHPVAHVPVFCPIWHAPWMSFNRTAYPDAMLRAARLVNVFAGRAGAKYFEVQAAEVAASGAAWTLLPTEPFPFHRKAVATADLGACGRPERVRVVDGEALTWFGVRTVEGLRALRAAADELRALAVA